MTAWGITIPAPDPGWNIPANLGPFHGWGQLVPTYPQPAPELGQFTDRVGFNSAFRFAAISPYQGWQPTLSTEFPQLVAQGFHHLRDIAEWRFIEPTTKGVYDWTYLDPVMTAAETYGIQILLCPSTTPAWARPSPGDHYNTPPADATDYADFCAALVTRYGNSPALTGLELWNEPWLWFGWQPDVNSTAYAALALEAAQRIKGMDSTVTVLLVGDYYVSTLGGDTTTEFFRPVITAQPTLPNYVDGYAIHPYVVPPAANGPHSFTPSYQFQFQRVTRLRDAARYLGIEKPVWITEVGWTNATGDPKGASEATTATYLYDTLARALIEWPGTSYRAQIERVYIHFYWRSINPADLTSVEGNYGLMDKDGNYKPAWTEIRKFR